MLEIDIDINDTFQLPDCNRPCTGVHLHMDVLYFPSCAVLETPPAGAVKAKYCLFADWNLTTSPCFSSYSISAKTSL